MFENEVNVTMKMANVSHFNGNFESYQFKHLTNMP